MFQISQVSFMNVLCKMHISFASHVVELKWPIFLILVATKYLYWSLWLCLGYFFEFVVVRCIQDIWAFLLCVLFNLICYNNVQGCVKRVQADETGHKHCTGQYFDYWQCVDKCVSLFSSTFPFISWINVCGGLYGHVGYISFIWPVGVKNINHINPFSSRWINWHIQICV